MKKSMIIISVLALGALFVAPTAFARNGGMGYNGQCPVYSDNAGDRQAFYDNTADLRAELAADRAERAALMAGTNPDPKRVRALAEKISKQQNQLRKHAEKYNVTLMGPGMGMGQGTGYCNTTGKGMGGHRGQGGRMMNR